MKKQANESEYSKLLRDPRWQRKRLEVLNDCEYRCQNCGATDKMLQVHHKHYVYGRKPWEYDKSELTCLCDTCHKELTEKAKKIKGFVDSVIGFGLADSICGYLKCLMWEHDEFKGTISLDNYDEVEAFMRFFGLYNLQTENVISYLLFVNGKFSKEQLDNLIQSNADGQRQ